MLNRRALTVVALLAGGLAIAYCLMSQGTLLHADGDAVRAGQYEYQVVRFVGLPTEESLAKTVNDAAELGWTYVGPLHTCVQFPSAGARIGDMQVPPFRGSNTTFVLFQRPKVAR